MGSWFIISLILVFGHFFLPFLMLLTQPAKRNPVRLCIPAAIILITHVIDLYWIILPEYQIRKAIKAGVTDDYYTDYLYFAPHWLDFTVFIGMIALVAGIFIWRRLPSSNLFPLRDPRLYESVTLKN
jgi:Ni/Fe-hydrogenase subunit HybB-like protein